MIQSDVGNKRTPVDLVYLWCDGNDPEFRARKQCRLQECGLPWNEDNLGDLRYVDNEELRFSLRSVYENLPWINHIFIVTDRQVPCWLKAHPKLSIVDHRDILPKELLPTFNSVTIEMYVHKIQGLSEKYLLLNDDMFIGTPLKKDFFFQGDHPIVRLREWKICSSIRECQSLLRGNEISDFAKTQLRAWELVASRYKLRFPYRLSHTIDAFTKSMVASVMEKYPVIEQTNIQPFRTAEDIQRVVFQMEMAFGLQSPLRIVRNPNFFEKYIYWNPRKHFECFGGNESNRLLQRITRFRPKMFYINSALKVDLEEKKRVKDFLALYFPNQSPFE